VVPWEVQEAQVILVPVESQAVRGFRDLLDQQDFLDPKALPENLERLVEVVLKDQRELLELQDLQVQRVTMEHLVLLVVQGPRVCLVQQVSLGARDQLERLEQVGLLVYQDRAEPQEIVVSLVVPEVPDHLDQQEGLEQLDQADQLELLGVLVALVLREELERVEVLVELVL